MPASAVVGQAVVGQAVVGAAGGQATRDLTFDYRAGMDRWAATTKDER